MLPTLADGEDVLVAQQPPAVGDVVVAEHPDPERDTVLVKRIDAVLDSGLLVLRSDNAAEGTDSRSFGPVAPETVIGVVTVRLSSLRRPACGCAAG